MSSVTKSCLKSAFKSAVGESTRILKLVVHQAEMSLRNEFDSITCLSLRSRKFFREPCA